MEGERVEIVIDAGGSTRSYDIAATRTGRRADDSAVTALRRSV